MTIFSVDDLKRQARRKLPRMIFDFIEGGALDEVTQRLNEQRFGEYFLCQRILRDISSVQTSTRILGQSIALPLIVAPMGALDLFHKGGDRAIARAAAQRGIIFIHSGWSCSRLEDVVRVAAGHVWAQIAFWHDPKLYDRHLGNIREQGVDTLVVSSDVVVSSKRYRNLRHGLFPPQRPPLRDLVNVACHPVWLWNRLTGPRLEFANLPGVRRGATMVSRQADWDSLRTLRREWKGKIVLKGVMCADDAEQAVAAGMDGIIVSNHGGRQFDSQPATIDMLDPIAHRVNDRLEVYLDGGITQGSDIAKALALGARAACAGRPMAYALAAGGEKGVAQAIDFMQDELCTVMSFLGTRDVAAINRDVLAFT